MPKPEDVMRVPVEAAAEESDGVLDGPTELTTDSTNLAVALSLASAGLPIFPARVTLNDHTNRWDKKPLIINWQQEATTDPVQIREWWKYYSDAVHGIELGRSGLVVIDADRHGGPDGVAALTALATEHGGLPVGPVTLTAGGGTHHVFRQRENERLGNSSGSLPDGVDVRGHGGWIVAPGAVRPDGAKWAPLEGAPSLAEAFVQGTIPELPEWIAALIRSPADKAILQVGIQSTPPDPLPNDGQPNANESSYAKTALQFCVVDLDSQRLGSRNTTLNRVAFRMGRMVERGWIEESVVIEALLLSCRRNGLIDDGEDAVRRTLSSGLKAGRKAPHPDLDGAAVNTRAAETKIEATPFVWREPNRISPREWLNGRHAARGFVSATIAPGGIGKTSLLLVEALAAATGRDLLGENPRASLKVWYWNGEDPKDEIDRRIAAACIHYGLSGEDFGGRLYTGSRDDAPIGLATETRGRIQIADSVIAELRRTILEHEIDLVILDPFVAIHAVSENDNTHINAVVGALARLAEEASCAIELVHHVRKGGQGKNTIDDARGAGALINATRSARILNPMTETDAAKAGIDNHRSYFRIDNGKANLTAPSDGAAWRKIISVPLGNGSTGYPSDEVGVVTAWSWPDPTQDVSTSDIEEILKRIAAGDYRANAQAKDWVGKVIADALNLDVNDVAAKAKIRGLIKAWLADGVLRLVEKNDGKGMPRNYVEVG